MSLQTQISGGYGKNLARVFQLKRRLEALDIHVTHPLGDGSFIIEKTPDQAGANEYQAYEVILDYYGSITVSSFHIIYNQLRTVKGYLDNDMAREIVYAMLKRKQIILLYPPLFQPDVKGAFRRIIERYLHQTFICNVTVLEDADLRRLLREVAKSPTAYPLTNTEKATIRQEVRAYFRDLLEHIPAA